MGLGDRFFGAGPGRVGPGDLRAVVAERAKAEARRRLHAAPDLTDLFWESTLRCNLRCRHCGSSCTGSSPFDELSTAEIRGIVDTIAADFDPRRIFVSITGGEPLLRDDLEEVAGHMEAAGMRTCIVSNGVLLDPRRAEALARVGMRTASISIDGVGAEHEEIRGRGSYAAALAGIRAARAAGFVDVEAITCVRPGNLDGLGGVEEAVREAGANLWRLITIDRMGRLAGGDGGGLWLAPPEVTRLLDFLAARRAALAGDPGLEVRFSCCGGYLGVRAEAATRPGSGGCFAGLNVGSILCDGHVAACPSLPRALIQGSARRARFSTIWRERFELHRDLAWRRRGPCAGCSYFELCLGGGLHERLAQPDDFCWLSRQAT